MTIFSTPESGVSTRYHSAESLINGSTPATYMAPAIMDSVEKPDGIKVDGPEEKVEPWPDVLIVTGLEDCESPLQMKLMDLVKLSKVEKAEEMLVIWVRDEGKSDVIPAWLVCSLPYSRVRADWQADNFVLSDTVLLEDLDPAPDLPRQIIIPPDVS